MRRKEKEIKDQAVLEELLNGASVCRIAMAPGPTEPVQEAGGDGPKEEDPCAGGSCANYPYIVPVHFVYSQKKIYIHSARGGKKIAMLNRNSRVCVEIDEYSGLIPAEKACNFGSRFRSLIAFGTARRLDSPRDKRLALELLMEKYAGRSYEFTDREVEGITIIAVELEQISGKQAV